MTSPQNAQQSIPSIPSPAIQKGADEIMKLINTALAIQASKKPTLVHAEAQTDQRELDHLKAQNSMFNDMNLSLQQRIVSLEAELRQKDSKIAELTAENVRLKDTAALKDDYMLNESENIQMTVSPLETTLLLTTLSA
ncbi:hypothetical protein BC835DRAFT_132084 [Cytidiella melzeri]|nr:hypothetical protein BC835DRAFT_132084 [Cytidiella melzeri]